MNDIFAAWLWCVLQVTLVGMLSAGAYLTVKRRWPRSAEGALLAGLALPILLTFTIFSPWPCWIAAEAPPAMAAPAAPQPTSAVVSADASVSPAGGYAPTPPAAENPDVVPASATPVPGDQAVPVAATPSPPRSPAIGLAVIAAVLAFGGLRLLIGWAAIRRVVAGSRPVDDAELQQLIAALLSKLRTRRCVVVRESASLRTAATVGWRRPLILLPDAWRTWSAGELRAVLAHELAHVSRGHFGAWIIAQCGLSLHVYHPLLHWLAARLRLELGIRSRCPGRGRRRRPDGVRANSGRVGVAATGTGDDLAGPCVFGPARRHCAAHSTAAATGELQSTALARTDWRHRPVAVRRHRGSGTATAG